MQADAAKLCRRPTPSGARAGSDENDNADDDHEDCDEFGRRLREARRLQSERRFAEAIEAFQGLLSEAASRTLEEGQGEGGLLLAKCHLLLAKCHKGLDDLKSAIASANSAIEHAERAFSAVVPSAGAVQTSLPQQPWKEPYLYRSACFQALHAKLLETAGDSEDNIERDRREANIIVDATLSNEDEEKVVGGQVHVGRLDQAISRAKDGDTIFIECGSYTVTSSSSTNSRMSSSPCFLFGKNVSIIGASTRDCILEYRHSSSTSASAAAAAVSSKLDTFLICAAGGTSASAPTLIKRLTFRSLSGSNTGNTTTRFLGVAAGNVHIEDCLFDGLADSSDVDAIYASSRICGAMAADFPPPNVSVRYCVFDHCQSYAAFTALRANGSVRSSLFVASRLSAMDDSDVSVENCEFATASQAGAEGGGQAVVSATKSRLSVVGCYVHNGAPSLLGRNAQAVSLAAKSSGQVCKNYIYRTGNGICCLDSDIVCLGNIILNCSKRHSTFFNVAELNLGTGDSSLGLYTGISLKIKAGSRMLVADNFVQRCDVAVYVGKEALPTVKNNTFCSSFFTGIFAECRARPNIIGNVFLGGKAPAATPSPAVEETSGLGVLLVLQSGGLVGKNTFENYQLSPIMTFASCHPLLSGNIFDKVVVDRRKQEEMEERMRELFRAELFKDDKYFYIVDSETGEQELRDVILNGKKTDSQTT